MPSGKHKQEQAQLKEVLPQTGMLYTEDCPSMALCKPKIMPLKSVTLEKLEKMQKDAQEAVKQQETSTPLQEPTEEQ